jgi:hypothetical protein
LHFLQKDGASNSQEDFQILTEKAQKHKKNSRPSKNYHGSYNQNRCRKSQPKPSAPKKKSRNKQK